ncbi:hypothetical protein ACNA6I_01245 [Rossellomorea sp. FS2]
MKKLTIKSLIVAAVLAVVIAGGAAAKENSDFDQIQAAKIDPGTGGGGK